MRTISFHTRTYERADRAGVLALTFYSRYSHSHLDWCNPEQWLDLQQGRVTVLYEGRRLVGFLGLSKPERNTSWIRLGAFREGYDNHELFGSLLNAAIEDLHAQGVHLISILAMSDWLEELLLQHGFEYVEHIVTLRRDSLEFPPFRQPKVHIRGVLHAELAAVRVVDHAAFVAPWGMSAADFRQAYRHAASFTVATYRERIIGYQISTRQQDSGHLARLGVLPVAQGHGVGTALLDHLLMRLKHRGVHSVTVNTQDSNTRSQRLYERYGFRRNGFDLPIYQRKLAPLPAQDNQT